MSRAKYIYIYIVSFVTTAPRLPSGQCIRIGVSFCNFAGEATRLFLDVFYPVSFIVLFMFVPMVLRRLSRWEGTTQMTHVELGLMNRVFVVKMVVRTYHVVPDERSSHVY